jgi:DNA-directed RNA polymerase subunit RPC12/RpoP
MKEKKCSRCGIEKPLMAFYIQKRGKYGKRSKCIACNKKVITKSRPGFWWDVNDKTIWKGFEVDSLEPVTVIKR